MTSSERRMAISSQVPPTGDGAVVLDAVLARMKEMEAAAHLGPVGYVALKEDLTARSAAGLKKYGTYLRVNNGRAAEVDVYQELLDAVMYSMQARLEEKNSISNQAFEMILLLAAALAVELNER